MLSTIPKLADRAFIIGFLLPTLLSVTIGLLIFGDRTQINDLLAQEKTTTIILMVAGAWLLSVLLLIGNRGIYRCLEGYLPPLSWRKRARLRTARRIAALRGQAKRLQRRMIAKDRPSSRDVRLYGGFLESLAELPADPRYALPTRFGNAIRAFETYPGEVYGADGVRLWLHVAPLVSKELLGAVSDARALVDFMVNATFFSLLIAASLIGDIAYRMPYSVLLEGPHTYNMIQVLIVRHWDRLMEFPAALVASAIFYRMAVSLVPSWGVTVKTCFDVGLPALAKKLGFELPDTQMGRKEFWSALSQTVIYRTYPDRSAILRAEHWLPRKPEQLPPSILKRMWIWLWGSSSASSQPIGGHTSTPQKSECPNRSASDALGEGEQLQGKPVKD